MFSRYGFPSGSIPGISIIPAVQKANVVATKRSGILMRRMIKKITSVVGTDVGMLVGSANELGGPVIRFRDHRRKGRGGFGIELTAAECRRLDDEERHRDQVRQQRPTRQRDHACGGVRVKSLLGYLGGPDPHPRRGGELK